MTAQLDLHDIQGIIRNAYVELYHLNGRYVFFKINDGVIGRKFISELVAAQLITTAAACKEREQELKKSNLATPTLRVASNLAFTYAGLSALGLPDESMRSFPADFRMGMKARHEILGDDGASAPERWDKIWQKDHNVHVLLSIDGVNEEVVEARYQEVMKKVTALNEEAKDTRAKENRPAQEDTPAQDAIELLTGHRGAEGEDLPYQSAAVLRDKNGIPLPTEHFHYTDGITVVSYEGQEKDPEEVIGAGKPTRESPTTTAGWQPLETGEFILGHRDETQEYPAAPLPPLLAYNGSFMVYRKLHENVASFDSYIEEAGKQCPDEGGEEWIAAKFVGRWRNGAPLVTFPTKADADKFGEEWKTVNYTLFSDTGASAEDKAKALQTLKDLKKQRVAFNYNADLSGARCPVGAHARRVNPRGSLEFGEKAYNTPGALIDRRRILRRGLPYGESTKERKDDGDHGIVFMALNASIERQFEFVQQQWIHYGNDFKLGNDKDPLLGNHEVDADGTPKGRMIIDGDKTSGRIPHFCANIPRFVETWGGEYFFIPSMTALRMIGEGIIDPT